MAWLDMVPGVAHIKAIAQVATGDKDGALRTMERFSTKTPVISHILAGVAKVVGDDETARECWNGANDSLNALPVVGHAKGVVHYTFGDVEGGNHAMKQSTNTSMGMMNSMPGVGHIKGLVHYALDDVEGGNQAMIAATRTTTVMGAGAGGFLLGGPAGAVVLGMGAGAEWDLGTAIVTDGKRLDGICKIIDKPAKVDSYFDAALSFTGDAMTGYSGGKLAERIVRKPEITTAENFKATRRSKGLPEKEPIAHKEVYSEVIDKETGQSYSGVNQSVRERYNDPATRPNEFLKQNSDINTPPGRHPSSCAEPQALHKLLKDQPHRNGSTLNTQLTTLEMRQNGDIYTIPRCDNCMAYKDVVGTCTTDCMVS
jgi:hypothetical protein